jgi:uncharacterized membrane protein
LRWLDYLLSFPGVEHLQNIHPLLVHFPLGLIPGALVLYLIAWLSGRNQAAWTGWWLLLLGVLGAASAVASGLYAAPGVMLDLSVKRHLLLPHRNLMLATLALALALLIWSSLRPPIPRRGRGVFVIALVVLVFIMGKGADYGARMVYDYNGGGNACSQPIEFSR